MPDIERSSDNWRDKIDAQQRHERLAATVRIAVGELCYLAEQMNDLAPVERIYAITEVLDAALKDGDVEYSDAR